ncbi:unnamed protein product [Euphydryas editha]|uniref:Uncharacterized protein n=1 Tax=Euphydryas editha TaxID=104508 RepID=A0AAU9UKG4_EUPED|nr:unnamed protein product [Euphydryas editha]
MAICLEKWNGQWANELQKNAPWCVFNENRRHVFFFPQENTLVKTLSAFGYPCLTSTMAEKQKSITRESALVATSEAFNDCVRAFSPGAFTKYLIRSMMSAVARGVVAGARSHAENLSAIGGYIPRSVSTLREKTSV